MGTRQVGAQALFGSTTHEQDREILIGEMRAGAERKEELALF